MEILNAAIQKQSFEYWLKKITVQNDWLADYMEEQKELPLLLSEEIPGSVVEDLRKVARNDISAYVLFFSVYSFLLYRYFGKNCLITSADLKLFSPSSAERLLFYASAISEDTTVKEMITGFQQELMAVLEKRDIDIYALLGAAENKGVDTDRLQCFAFQHETASEQSQLADKSRLKLLIRENEGALTVQLQVNGFREGKLIGQQFIDHYAYLLSEIQHLLDRRIADIELPLPAVAKVAIPEDTTTVLDLFKTQAQQQPEQIALVSRGIQYTYAKLDDESNKLANYLLTEEQVTKGQPVALLLPRSEWILTGILGILKAGAAFVPLDPAWPVNRLQYILDDAGVEVLLTTTEYLAQLPSFKGKLFAFDIQQDMLPVAPAPEISINGSDAAYIMYTSGTTGQPKGVVIEHKGIANYATWLHNDFQFGAGDATILVTSYAFDLGYTAIWGAIPWGATLHIPGEDYSKMPEKLYDYLAAQQISFIKLTPSLFHLLLNVTNNTNRLSLKKIFLGGEMIRPTDIAAFTADYPDTLFVNHYGPTESTVGCIFHRVRRETFSSFAARPVIGRPIRNTEVLILDEYLHVLPHGVWGEICVSGPGVAKGYLNKPEVTEKQFVSKDLAVNGRVYRTGDYGRYLGNGTIELKGRKDNQAKIRGYRVELEEIEKCLANYPDIHEAAVLLQRAAGDQHAKLVAFYTLAETRKEVSSEAIINFLKAYLPEYMIPSDIIPLDVMPVNENGKLNRQELSASLATKNTRRRSKQVSPVNETERIILKVWQDVLKRNDISTIDSFFELGGNSLLLVQVNITLNEFFPSLTITDLFAHINIAALAAHIDRTDDTTGMSLAGTGIHFPADYFGAETPSAELFVALSEEASASVSASAIACGISEIDICIGTFAYALGKSAETGDVLFHLYEGEGKLKRLSVPVHRAETKEQLYSTAALQRAHPELVFQADSVIRPTTKDEMTWPLISLNGKPAVANGIFDIILTIQQKEGVLAFSLEHTPRLNPEKIEALLDLFVSMLERA
ncbi:non-ribosomal peptide synthetase [Chitinophaga pinensis]|uniref:Amino acid adenylation domain protein n=1 Tax=Chitinophaga pinensis (strain ATCC 43595 / DSM 2588 / LMG 13176 / NBRC 15968 / NCIMB 11800 / UQM 2034) TaxID=485918 RepID=A0A979G579_CHIPD|nr:non-ribosomal peptide synthetase [Chitinophaga pinensis]ACU60883.1 amino acid adenylation domain protein [Chitinophaga pinensis DSM 2588]